MTTQQTFKDTGIPLLCFFWRTNIHVTLQDTQHFQLTWTSTSIPYSSHCVPLRFLTHFFSALSQDLSIHIFFSSNSDLTLCRTSLIPFTFYFSPAYLLHHTGTFRSAPNSSYSWWLDEKTLLYHANKQFKIIFLCACTSNNVVLH